MTKAKTDYRVGVGSSSVLMILVILAMTALGLLALDSARNTAALTQRNVQMSKSYYEAAAKIQQKLAMIDEAALKFLTAHPGEALDAEWFEGFSIEGAQWETIDGEVLFTLFVDAQTGLGVTARGKLLSSGSSRYELLEHRFLNSGSEESESQFLDLMGE